MELLKQLGAVTAVITISLLAVGCYGEPEQPVSVATVPAADPGSSTIAPPESVLPGMAPLGTPLPAKGATVTPHAENLAMTQLPGGDDLELGVQVSLAGVTTPIDVAGPDGGFRLYVSSGELIPPAPPGALTQPPLASPVRADADGWVFFHIKPGTHPIQLQLIAAPAGFGLVPQPVAVWIMPSTPVAAPIEPPRPPSDASPALGGGGGGGVPAPPPRPHWRPPALPPPPRPPGIICRHTSLC